MYLKYFSMFKLRPKLYTDILRLRYFRTLSNNYAKVEAQDDNEEVNKPVKFLKSDAAKWKAQVTRTGAVEEYPWYQTYVIVASLSVFMMYFFVLREESDIDLEFARSLYDRIEGLEERQLEAVVDYNRSKGLPYMEEKKRLQEIKQNPE